MKEYFTAPNTYSPEGFDQRYTSDNLSFWVSHFIRLGRISKKHRVLDIGCGTGGFTISIYKKTNSQLVGFDIAEQLLEKAKSKPDGCRIDWIQGSAESLPFPDSSFDRVIMSLVIQQVQNKQTAFSEVFRILKNSGRLLVRTVNPEDAGIRIPFCFFPKVAEIESNRLPKISDLCEFLALAGFQNVEKAVINRNKRISIDEIADTLISRSRPSYNLLTDKQIDDGIGTLKLKVEKNGGRLIDPRPTTFLIGHKFD